MKTLLSAFAIGAALTMTGAGISTADAASGKTMPTAQQQKSDATDFSAQRRHHHGHRHHGHRHHHWRGHRHGYYGPRYYAPRPAYGYGRPYGYGGPGISFSFGGPRYGW